MTGRLVLWVLAPAGLGAGLIWVAGYLPGNLDAVAIVVGFLLLMAALLGSLALLAEILHWLRGGHRPTPSVSVEKSPPPPKQATVPARGRETGDFPFLRTGDGTEILLRVAFEDGHPTRDHQGWGLVCRGQTLTVEGEDAEWLLDALAHHLEDNTHFTRATPPGGTRWTSLLARDGNAVTQLAKVTARGARPFTWEFTRKGMMDEDYELTFDLTAGRVTFTSEDGPSCFE